MLCSYTFTVLADIECLFCLVYRMDIAPTPTRPNSPERTLEIDQANQESQPRRDDLVSQIRPVSLAISDFGSFLCG